MNNHITDILGKANQELFINPHRKLINDESMKGLVIIAMGGHIELYDNNVLIDEITEYRPSIYHRLKEISHLYISVYLSDLDADKNNKNEIKNTIEYLLSNINDLVPHLYYKNLKEYFINDLIENIRKFLIHINDYLNGKTKDFKTLNQQVFEYLDQFITISAETAEQELHNVIQSMKFKLEQQGKISKWDEVSVVVLGRSVHRIGDASMQYFGRLTGKQHEQLSGYFKTGWEPTESEIIRKKDRKLLYGENINDTKTAQSLLGEYVIAQKIGKDIFGNDLRMLYDLLAEKSANWLKNKCDHH